MTFPARLLQGATDVPEGYTVRPLEAGDYDKNFLSVLAQLTAVGNIAKEAWLDRFNWLKDRCDQYLIVVIEEVATSRVVGSGTLLIEYKFIHECGKVGHIEDIVIDSGMRGKNLGKIMIQALLHLGKVMGAYKTILDCKESNVAFYEKCGLARKDVMCALYYDEASMGKN